MSLLILVVDNEPDTEALFRQKFRLDMKQGRCTLEFALSGAVALGKLEGGVGEPSILLLSDIDVPGMTWLTLLRQVKLLRPTLPIIMLAADDDATTLRLAREAGADAVFGKPIDFDALKAAIDQRFAARGIGAR